MSTTSLAEFAHPGRGHQIDDSTVWHSRDFPDDRSWVHELDDAMRDEIRALTVGVVKEGIQPQDIRAAHFPLKASRALVQRVYDEVENQRGFGMIGGFVFDDFDELHVRTAYAGLCSHFGTITVQNRNQEIVLEVMNKGMGYDQASRGYHSNKHLDFHNDGTNTVTLLCMETAQEGGLSMLVSGPALYNEIAQTRPEYLEPLMNGFHHHKRDQLEPGDDPVTPYRSPVFSFREGVFHMAYAGPSILYCENEGIEITDFEKEALAYLEEVLTLPKMRIQMELRKGDIQFVNNFVVLHARTEYRDGPNQIRRLLRLWLDDESSRRIGPGKMDWYMPMYSRYTRLAGLAHNA